MSKHRKNRIYKCTALMGLVLIGFWVISCCGGQPKDGAAPDNVAVYEEELILVNRWNPIPDDYDVELVELSNGQYVDRLCVDSLTEMLDACSAAGLQPLVCSGYRGVELQNQLYKNKIQRLMDQGLSRRDAETAAQAEVAYPGTSEHHTGLAADIVDINNQNLDSTQEHTAVQQWLIAHSWEYGFVLRYPDGKSDITGIIYEPWHYRYVGREAAKIMYEQDLCLEEYLKSIS